MCVSRTSKDVLLHSPPESVQDRIHLSQLVHMHAHLPSILLTSDTQVAPLNIDVQCASAWIQSSAVSRPIFGL